MKKQSKNFFREVKKQADKTIDDVKQYTTDTKEMLEVYQAFKKEAVKFKKITSDYINLELPIYGMIDTQFEKLTFRAKDLLEEGQLLKTGKHILKVESIQDDVVLIPIKVKDKEHQVECKIAMIKEV